jgi:hypothetical protein
VRAADAEKADLVEHKSAAKFRGFGAAAPPRAAQSYQVNTYATLHDGVAEVEVPQTKLTKSPHTLEEMELKATVVLAEERQEKLLPAVVMEQPAEIVPGIRLRVTGLELSAAREMTITAKCDRPKGGPSGPFVEQVWVLDENNEKIAGARWTQGDPFGQAVTLTAKLTLTGHKVHKSLNFVACTKYSLKTLEYKVGGVFQK